MTQAGASWIAGYQIADGIMETAKDSDRISLWTANQPNATKNLTKRLLARRRQIRSEHAFRGALKQYREKEFPAGTTDLKNALAEAIRVFDDSRDRQRIILFLGDGLSTFNKMDEPERQAIARTMVDAAKSPSSPFRLASQASSPTTLHGLANATGGTVLRTRVEEEKLPDALKRYEEAFKCAPCFTRRNCNCPPTSAMSARASCRRCAPIRRPSWLAA